MNLYCRIPFGRQNSRAPEVIELARALGRTPGSVAMKLGNLTSLDPEEAARGIGGLTSASRLDRQVWDEFHSDWETLAAESEGLWRRRVGVQVDNIGSSEPADSTHDPNEPASGMVVPPGREPNGPTEGTGMSRTRLAQDFFRRAVLTAYGVRCCVSGIPVSQLLVASHILPWSRFPEHRIDPCNGLCLSRLHDAAFDHGLITFDAQNRLVLSRRLKDHLPNDSLQQNFVAFAGSQIRSPERFPPSKAFLSQHREQVFQD